MRINPLIDADKRSFLFGLRFQTVLSAINENYFDYSLVVVFVSISLDGYAKIISSSFDI